MWKNSAKTSILRAAPGLRGIPALCGLRLPVGGERRYDDPFTWLEVPDLVHHPERLVPQDEVVPLAPSQTVWISDVHGGERQRFDDGVSRAAGGSILFLSTPDLSNLEYCQGFHFPASFRPGSGGRIL
jgi:hypothetical protein